jgi:hypothetical protein
MPADCKKRRSGVCFWKFTLLGVPDTFDALRPWLEIQAPPPAPSASASAPTNDGGGER